MLVQYARIKKNPMQEKIIESIRLIAKDSANKISFANFEKSEHSEIILSIEEALAKVPTSCFYETSRIFTNINNNNQYSMF